MAVGYLALKTISRSRGQSAVAAAAYRCGIEVDDERTGQSHDYTRRAGVVSVDVIGWDGTAGELANAMEAAEARGNAVVARELVLALPAEASPLVRRALVQVYAEWLRERHGVAVIAAIHAPGRTGDARNHHAHLMLTTRRCDGRTLGLKTRELDTIKTGSGHLEAWRAQWGQMIGVDMRSYERQGIEREAEPKMPRPADREAYRAARAADPAALRSEAGALQRQIDAAERRSLPVRPRTRPLTAVPGRHPLPMGVRLDQRAYERRITPAQAPAPRAPAPPPPPPPALPWAERMQQWRAVHRPSPTPPARVPHEPRDSGRDRSAPAPHVPPTADPAERHSAPDWIDPGPSGMG